jgi:hypothetical protein
MKFQKGHSGNPEGRKAGTPNRAPEEIRKFVQLFIERNLPRIQKDFDLMKPVEKLTFLNALLKHVLPAPVTFDGLNDDQLDQLILFLKRKFKYEKD